MSESSHNSSGHGLPKPSSSSKPPDGIKDATSKQATATSAPKLGSWTLNKTEVKKLGIKSSVLQALTKLAKKSTTSGDPGASNRSATAAILPKDDKPTTQPPCPKPADAFKQPAVPASSLVAAEESRPHLTSPNAELQRVKQILNSQIMQRERSRLEALPTPLPIAPLPVEQPPAPIATTSTTTTGDAMRGFQRQDSADSQSTLELFDKYLSGSETGDAADDDPQEADDEISDAETQRRRRLLALHAQKLAAGPTSRRHKPADGTAEPATDASAAIDECSESNSQLSHASAAAGRTAALSGQSRQTYTTTDDDESEPLRRPARILRRVVRNRSSAATATATAAPAPSATPAAAASAAILSDNTVDYICGTLTERCDQLAKTAAASFAPAIALPEPADVLAAQDALATPKPVTVKGVVKINKLLGADRALLMKLLKTKSKKPASDVAEVIATSNQTVGIPVVASAVAENPTEETIADKSTHDPVSTGSSEAGPSIPSHAPKPVAAKLPGNDRALIAKLLKAAKSKTAVDIARSADANASPMETSIEQANVAAMHADSETTAEITKPANEHADCSTEAQSTTSPKSIQAECEPNSSCAPAKTKPVAVKLLGNDRALVAKLLKAKNIRGIKASAVTAAAVDIAQNKKLNHTRMNTTSDPISPTACAFVEPIETTVIPAIAATTPGATKSHLSNPENAQIDPTSSSDPPTTKPIAVTGKSMEILSIWTPTTPLAAGKIALQLQQSSSEKLILGPSDSLGFLVEVPKSAQVNCFGDSEERLEVTTAKVAAVTNTTGPNSPKPTNENCCTERTAERRSKDLVPSNANIEIPADMLVELAESPHSDRLISPVAVTEPLQINTANLDSSVDSAHSAGRRISPTPSSISPESFHGFAPNSPPDAATELAATGVDQPMRHSTPVPSPEPMPPRATSQMPAEPSLLSVLASRLDSQVLTDSILQFERSKFATLLDDDDEDDDEDDDDDKDEEDDKDDEDDDDEDDFVGRSKAKKLNESSPSTVWSSFRNYFSEGTSSDDDTSGISGADLEQMASDGDPSEGCAMVDDSEQLHDVNQQKIDDLNDTGVSPIVEITDNELVNSTAVAEGQVEMTMATKDVSNVAVINTSIRSVSAEKPIAKSEKCDSRPAHESTEKASNVNQEVEVPKKIAHISTIKASNESEFEMHATIKSSKTLNKRTSKKAQLLEPLSSLIQTKEIEQPAIASNYNPFKTTPKPSTSLTPDTEVETPAISTIDRALEVLSSVQLKPTTRRNIKKSIDSKLKTNNTTERIQDLPKASVSFTPDTDVETPAIYSTGKHLKETSETLNDKPKSRRAAKSRKDQHLQINETSKVIGDSTKCSTMLTPDTEIETPAITAIDKPATFESTASGNAKSNIQISPAKSVSSTVSELPKPKSSRIAKISQDRVTTSSSAAYKTPVPVAIIEINKSDSDRRKPKSKRTRKTSPEPNIADNKTTECFADLTESSSSHVPSAVNDASLGSSKSDLSKPTAKRNRTATPEPVVASSTKRTRPDDTENTAAAIATTKRKRDKSPDQHETPKSSRKRTHRSVRADKEEPTQAIAPLATSTDKSTTPESKRNSRSIKDYFSPSTSPPEVNKAKRSRVSSPTTTASADDEYQPPGRRGGRASAPVRKAPATAKPAARKSKAATKAQASQSVNVTCAICKESVQRKQWMTHFHSHYGQTWIEGEDAPLIMEPPLKVGNRMTLYAKKYNVTGFVCKKCGVSKKSGLGYLSHSEICGLTAEQIADSFYKCPHCPSQIRQASVAAHVTYCNGLRKQRRDAAKLSGTSASGANELSDTEQTPSRQNNAGRAERKSAAKAKDTFKQLDANVDEKPQDFVVRRFVTINGSTFAVWREALASNGVVACRHCKFTTTVFNDMAAHHQNCEHIKNYACKACTFRAVSADKVAAHAAAIHLHVEPEEFSDSGSDAELGEASSESELESGVDELDEDADSDRQDGDDADSTKKKSKPKKKRTKKSKKDASDEQAQLLPDRRFLDAYRPYLDNSRLTNFYPAAKTLTEDFHKRHYSPTLLLADIPAKFSPLADHLPFLPPSAQSPPFSFQAIAKYQTEIGSETVSAWQSQPRFGSTSSPRSHILYCGGPIQCTRWIPLPGDYPPENEQFLAIITRPSPDFKVYSRLAHSTRCSLQLWSMRGLPPVNASETDREANAPRLRYMVGIEDGPVLSVAFMPSGGYEPGANGRRLAVLALPSFGGDVRLLGLPRVERVPTLGGSIELSGKLGIRLRASPGTGMVSRICWSQTRGHRTIVAGYVSGAVMVWNLDGLGNPLLQEEAGADGVRTLSCTLALWPTAMMVTQLDLHHDSDGADRWLAVGGLDKKVKFFDLRRPDVESTQYTHKSRVTGGVWPLHWAVYLTIIDDAFGFKACGLAVTQPLNLGTRSAHLSLCSGTPMDVSFSDWLNTYVYVTDYGEIRAAFCRQLLFNFADKRHKALRGTWGYTDVIPVANVAEEVAEEMAPNAEKSDAEIALSHGIVFCDFKSPLYDSASSAPTQLRVPKTEITHLTRIMTVTFNPNSSAFRLIAFGYETGFVRVCHVRR